MSGERASVELWRGGRDLPLGVCSCGAPFRVDPCGELVGSVLLGGDAFSAVQAGTQAATLLAQSSGCVGAVCHACFASPRIVSAVVSVAHQLRSGAGCTSLSAEVQSLLFPPPPAKPGT